jgi:hypothetical protein
LTIAEGRRTGRQTRSAQPSEYPSGRPRFCGSREPGVQLGRCVPGPWNFRVDPARAMRLA